MGDGAMFMTRSEAQRRDELWYRGVELEDADVEMEKDLVWPQKRFVLRSWRYVIDETKL